MTDDTKRHLPVVSSAASTDFVSAKVEGPDGVYLYFDGNQKVSGWNPKPNAFSLVQIEDCPGSTPTCRSACYVNQLETAVKHVHDLYRHNSKTIREILASPHVATWARIVADWITENCADVGFRWSVSGDLFSPTYAGWVATVIAWSPNVRHWLYTRSFAFTASLTDLPNLTLNYSVDRDNYVEAQRYVKAHADNNSPVRQCYMVLADGEVPADLPPGSVIFPDYALRAPRMGTVREMIANSPWLQSLTIEQRKMVCPTDAYGKSEKRRCNGGPTPGGCTLCIDPVVTP